MGSDAEAMRPQPRKDGDRKDNLKGNSKDNPKDEAREKIVEVHKCPLGVVINPFWLKVASVIGLGLCSLAGLGIQQGFSFASGISNAVAQNSLQIEQYNKSNFVERVAKIEAVQSVQVEAQDRMERKMDAMFEHWAIPNPAPKPDPTPTAAGPINTLDNSLITPINHN